MLPAHAGMIRVRLLKRKEWNSAPRACGDDPSNSITNRCVSGVLPAHAGMIRAGDSPKSETWRAPRACGDDPDFKDRDLVGVVCSPRMRG